LTSDCRKKRGKRKGSRKQSTSHRKNENTRTANTSLRKTAKAKLELLARVLKLDMDNPADREKLRRAILDLVAGEKCESKNAVPSVVDCYFHHRMNLPCSVILGDPFSGLRARDQ
jgi:hypothetical protein